MMDRLGESVALATAQKEDIVDLQKKPKRTRDKMNHWAVYNSALREFSHETLSNLVSLCQALSDTHRTAFGRLCADMVVQAIRGATNTVYVLAYSLDNPHIVDALVVAGKPGGGSG